MKIYSSLLVLVQLAFTAYAIQFEDEVNLEQTELPDASGKVSGGFFPASDEIDNRYSSPSGLKYVDYENFSDIRKQLNFNGNLPVIANSPTPSHQSQQYYYQLQQQRPSGTINHSNAIRKRPTFPYQFASSASNNYYTSAYPPDFSNSINQNYANYYQYTSSSPSPSAYFEYYNPTRYPSPSPSPSSPLPSNANLYGHQTLQQQQYYYPPNYYTNNYANQFGYQQRPTAASSGISNFFNNIRDSNSPVARPLSQLSQVGTQFSKALEDISLNDDLQCVPKLICKMIRDPRRPNQLPSFLNVPGISAIISALPSSSPIMNFGRAALLGLSGGECDISYPRCPRDENQILYYLNNHRGGFFRFFNGGNSFGDEDNLQNLQQNVNQQQLAGTSQGLNLLALQALADAFNGGGSNGNAFNLNNLFSSATSSQYPRPTVQQNYQGLQADQSQNVGLFSMLKPSTISEAVSNLLTGVVGNRYSRQINKRNDEIDDHHEHKIQKRIVHLKDNEENFFQGPQNNYGQQHVNTLYDDLNEKPFKFSNENRNDNNLSSSSSSSYRQQYAIKFPHEQGTSVAANQGTIFVSSADVARRLKMLFPDIENFGEQFNQNLLSIVNSRIGKILNTGGQPQQTASSFSDLYSINRYPPYQQNYAGSSSSNYNNNNNKNNNYDNKRHQENRSHIVYVTNSRGQVEYTLNELTGEKKRVL